MCCLFAFVSIGHIRSMNVTDQLFIKDFSLQWMPFVIIHFVQDLHVEDGRDNGSEPYDGEGDKLAEKLK